MRKSSKKILAIIFILFTHGAYSQKILDGVYTKSDEEQISDIDRMTQRIKVSLKIYKKIEKFIDSSDYSYIYKNGKELQLISIYKKGQDFTIINSYYFQYGKLIYAEQESIDRKSTNVSVIEKMYFDNENLFTWTQSGSKVDSNSDGFKKTTKEVYDYVMKLRIENM